MTLITVFGGTGFLGRRIVERLTREGATLRVAVRHPDRVDTPAKSIGSGRTIPVAADVRDPSTVAAAIAGSESVVNAVSAYVETGGVTYAASPLVMRDAVFAGADAALLPQTLVRQDLVEGRLICLGERTGEAEEVIRRYAFWCRKARHGPE